MRPLLLAALLPLLPAPALALTPDELLATWEAQVLGMGAPMFPPFLRAADGSASLAGLGPDGSQTMTLRATGDGGVAIEGEIPASSRMRVDGGEVEWRQQGLALVARDGAGPGAVRYQVTAPSLQVVTIPGMQANGQPLDVAVELRDALLEVEVPGDAGGLLEVAVTAEGLGYLVSMTDAMGTAQTVSSLSDGLAMRYAVTLPAGLAPTAWAELGDLPEAEMTQRLLGALRDGLAIEVTATARGSRQQGTMDSPLLSYAYAIAGGASSVTALASLDGVAMQASAEGAELTLSSPMIPVPEVEASMGPLEVAIDLPFGAAPAPFTYRVAVSDLTVGEEGWAALDPGGLLPRDPARMVIDVGGLLAMDVAGMIEAGAQGGMAEMPEPRIDSVEIRQVEVGALGARAAATGSFAFDAAMTPSGSATVTLEGASRLLDLAEQMGLVPADQIAQARLGLGMFFDPVEGSPDALAAAVQLGADGSVTVNGQRVQ